MGRPWIRVDTRTRENNSVRRLRKRCRTSWMLWYVLLEVAGDIDASGHVLSEPGIYYTPGELAAEMRTTTRTLVRFLDAAAEIGLICTQTWHAKRAVHVVDYDDYQPPSDVSTKRVQKHREATKKQRDMFPEKRDPDPTNDLLRGHTTGELTYRKTSSEVIDPSPDKVNDEQIAEQPTGDKVEKTRTYAKDETGNGTEGETKGERPYDVNGYDINNTPTPREQGTNPRATGRSPREQGTNPRAMGTNPRAIDDPDPWDEPEPFEPETEVEEGPENRIWINKAWLDATGKMPSNVVAERIFHLILTRGYSDDDIRTAIRITGEAQPTVPLKYCEAVLRRTEEHRAVQERRAEIEQEERNKPTLEENPAWQEIQSWPKENQENLQEEAKQELESAGFAGDFLIQPVIDAKMCEILEREREQ